MTLFLTEAGYRDAARRLLDFAGLGPIGRPQTDPVYLSITEGREGLNTHSGTSCGELGHWLLMRLGIRCAWVNRNENHGWRPGVNISLLAFNPVSKYATLTDQYKPGDLILIWEKPDTTDAHCMAVVDFDPTMLVLTTAEYGQPGGKLATHQLRQGTDMASGKARPALFCGGRALQKWVPLLDALKYADDHSELKEPDLSCLDVPDAPITGAT